MKNNRPIIPVLLFLGMLIPSFMASRQFTDPFTLPKYFYFFFFSALFLGVFALWNLNRKFKSEFKFTWLDLAVGAYIVYHGIHALFTPDVSMLDSNYRIVLVSGLAYICLKPFLRDNDANRKTIHYLLVGLVLVNYLQAGYGLLEYFDIIPQFQDEFNIGGAYGNPGPYTNFLVALVPFSLALVVIKRKESKSLLGLALITLVLTLIVLPLTHARTSWIAVMVSSGYFLLLYTGIGQTVKAFLDKLWIKILAGALVLLIGVATTIFLFKFKEQSASGRLFVWKVSAEMIADKPLFGFGTEKYATAHNDYQAKYFAEHPDAEEEAELADAVSYAFNEFIQIASESGIVGLAIFLAIIAFTVVKRRDEDTRSQWLGAAEAGLIALLIAGLFSYPFRVIPNVALFLFYLAIISANASLSVRKLEFNQKNRRLLSVALLAFVFFLFIQNNRRFNASREWKEAFQLVREGRYEEAEEAYEDLYSILSYNHYFLFNYGAELSVMGKYKRSAEVLEEAKPRLNDPDLYIYLGNSYSGLGKYKEAAECFQQASMIMPIKFYPRYRLVKTWLAMGEEEKALGMARELVEKKVKIPSEIVDNIKAEMEQLLHQYESRTGE